MYDAVWRPEDNLGRLFSPSNTWCSDWRQTEAVGAGTSACTHSVILLGPCFFIKKKKS